MVGYSSTEKGHTMYELRISFDHDCERPDENAIGRIVSFNNRHHNSGHPDTYTNKDCPHCSGYGGTNTYDPNKSPGGEWVECGDCEGIGVVDCSITDHPDVLAVLSYYEHGLCRWMVGPSTVPDYGGFDTSNFAGVIVWNGAESEREWWAELTDEHRRQILDGIAEEYTSWCNGEVYGYQLTKLDHCGECGHATEGSEVDSCWGFIGTDYFNEHINELLGWEKIDLRDVHVSGEASDYIELKSPALEGAK